MENVGILLMAYGTPNTLEEIEPYYTDIRGRKPTPENLSELVARYQRIGGGAVTPARAPGSDLNIESRESALRTPLLDITRAQAQALQSLLGGGFRVYVGMKHWHPYISQAVSEIVRDGCRRVIALALAPHYSKFSIDGYIQRVRDAIQELGAKLDVTYIESWNDHPLFLRAVAEKMLEARRAFGVSDWDEINVVFSAHSLPERILKSNDPYPQELRETCEGVAPLIGLKQWRFAYQSAGRTGEPWLGPDILKTLDEIAHGEPCEGSKPSQGSKVLIAPIGFVTDHLEVLYDIDIECAERAQRLGLDLKRIESQNASPAFIAALAAIVREHL